MIGLQEIILILIALIFIIGPSFFLIGIVIWLVFFRGRQKQGQTIKDKKRICSKCGWQNDTDAKFCSGCGFKFVQENQSICE
jgi:hypothetical protein